MAVFLPFFSNPRSFCCLDITQTAYNRGKFENIPESWVSRTSGSDGQRLMNCLALLTSKVIFTAEAQAGNIDVIVAKAASEQRGKGGYIGLDVFVLCY